MNKSKSIFYILWLILLSLAPITILVVTPISYITRDTSTLISAIQRLIGLGAYTLLFVQIILGSFMTRLTEKFGGWIFKFHIFQGILVYGLILLHPLLFVLLNYVLGRGFDPFYVFIDVCLICKKGSEMYYNFGRLAFWAVTVAVFAGYFRTTNNFLRIHWKKLHILNYAAFFFVWFHSLKLGSDIGTFPFYIFHGSAALIVLGILLYRLYGYFKS